MASATCPECEGEVSFDGDVMKGEIAQCPDCGVELEVIGGDEEVRLAALGAVFGLPIEDGLLLDLGGGSLLLARIEDRATVDAWSFPLGTLRLTDRFIVLERGQVAAEGDSHEADPATLETNHFRATAPRGRGARR